MAPFELPTAGFSWPNAPLSRIEFPLVVGILYVVLVLLLNSFMKVRKSGLNVKYLQAVHNMILCLISLALFCGTARELFYRLSSSSTSSGMLGAFTFLFCEDPDIEPKGPLYLFSYFYYLSKYYELLDTILQILKGREPPHFFLHVYHHATVLLMAWAWIEYKVSLQFIALLFNTGVHVVMYYYYFCRSLGWRVWWKRYVTMFQIVQFCTSFLFYMVTIGLTLSGYECAGSTMLLANLVFNATLLYQFLGVIEQPKAKAS
jgi:hypothetical protein